MKVSEFLILHLKPFYEGNAGRELGKARNTAGRAAGDAVPVPARTPVLLPEPPLSFLLAVCLVFLSNVLMFHFLIFLHF